jgi:hypothetical protein
MADIHAMVQSAKARLFKGAMSEGGGTRRAMECLCFRLLRDNDTQPDRSLLSFIEEIKASNLAETPRTIHSQGWWAESLLETAELNDTNLLSKGVPAGGHQHLLSWAKGMLSAKAIGTIVKYDISCAEELIKLTDKEWVPIPWLLGTDEDPPPGGHES